MRSELLRRAAPVLLSAVALGMATVSIAQESAPDKAPAKNQRIDPASLKATGKPVSCLPMNMVQSTIQAGTKAIMFSTGGNKWYRNDLRNGCSLLGSDRILVFNNMTNGQYCSLDMFSVVDNASRVNYGSCSLGEFTPVTVPKNARF